MTTLKVYLFDFFILYVFLLYRHCELWHVYYRLLLTFCLTWSRRGRWNNLIFTLSVPRVFNLISQSFSTYLIVLLLITSHILFFFFIFRILYGIDSILCFFLHSLNLISCAFSNVHFITFIFGIFHRIDCDFSFFLHQAFSDASFVVKQRISFLERLSHTYLLWFDD